MSKYFSYKLFLNVIAIVFVTAISSGCTSNRSETSFGSIVPFVTGTGGVIRGGTGIDIFGSGSYGKVMPFVSGTGGEVTSKGGLDNYGTGSHATIVPFVTGTGGVVEGRAGLAERCIWFCN